MQKQAQLYYTTFSSIPLTDGIFCDKIMHLPKEEINFLHHHECIEFGICVSGAGLVVIDDRFESIQSGDVMFLAPDIQHYSRSMDACRCQFFYLDPSCLCSSLINVDELTRRLRAAQSDVLRGEASSIVRDIIGVLPDAASDMHASELLCMHLSRLVLTLPAAKSSEMHTDPLVYSAASYIKLHYAEPLRVRELAAFVHLSESRLRQRFRAAYGCLPHEFINNVRVNVGANLLLHTSLSIADIADRTGFCNTSEFYRNFCAVHGISPSDYRRRSQSSNPSNG